MVINQPQKPSWRNSDFICALADSDRHLGHLVKVGEWHAYDATQPNDASIGFKYLGAFVDLAAARQAVESSVAGARGTRAMGSSAN
jgi:hypothetical protein